MEDREARMALACVSEPADRALRALVDAEGAVAVWQSLSGPRRDTVYGRRAAGVRLREVELLTRRHRLRHVVPGDAEWPESLADLHRAVSNDGMGGIPLGLWLGGPADLAEWTRRSVAVVGSRASTSYGETVATDLGADLAAAGIGVVSGGAYGIDVCAHRGALAGGGRTIAVLANGVDAPYPRGNAKVFDMLLAEHLVISELPPGTHPTRSRFLGRNRLIAALSDVTVLVEAAVRSGARNTCSWAHEMGRPVRAVPGPITSATSATPNMMIRDHQADLITGAGELKELLAPMGQDLLPIERGRPRVLDGLGAVQRTVFETVPGRGGLSPSDLSLRSGVELLSVLDALADLEAMGLVEMNDRGGWRMVSGAVG